MLTGSRLASRLRTLGWIVAASAAVGFSAGLARTLAGSAPNPWRGLVTATAIGLSTGAVELLFLSDALRRVRFTAALLIKTLVHGALITAVFAGASWLFAARFDLQEQYRTFAMVAGLGGGCIFVGTFLRSVTRLVGGGVFRDFLTGRYHQPVEETRVFMFVDLVGSTSIAERIGHVQFYRLLRDFFHDLTEPVLASGGEIYKYVGDEVIVAWSTERALRGAACLRCVFDMADAIARNAGRYEREFGCVPEFRAGLHTGAVVVGEIGDDRQEIAFLGDVMNTCARIQGECKTVNRQLLLSGELLSRLSPPPWAQVERVGAIRLRGKDRETELFSVTRAPVPPTTAQLPR